MQHFIQTKPKMQDNKLDEIMIIDGSAIEHNKIIHFLMYIVQCVSDMSNDGCCPPPSPPPHQHAASTE